MECCIFGDFWQVLRKTMMIPSVTTTPATSMMPLVKSSGVRPDWRCCGMGQEGSPAVIGSAEDPPEGWIPPKQFLLGLGHPWGPEPWDSCYDDDDEDADFIAASQ